MFKTINTNPLQRPSLAYSRKFITHPHTKHYNLQTCISIYRSQNLELYTTYGEISTIVVYLKKKTIKKSLDIKILNYILDFLVNHRECATVAVHSENFPIVSIYCMSPI